MAAAVAGDGATRPFDVSQFDSVVKLQALRVRKEEVHQLCVVLRRLGALFDMPRLCSVVADESSPEERLVLLNEAATDAGVCLRRRSRRAAAPLTPLPSRADLSGLCDEAKRVVLERKLTPEPYVQKLTYDYWPADHVLKARLAAAERILKVKP